MNYRLTFADADVPTVVYIQEGAVKQLQRKLEELNKPVLLITGRTGAQRSGALEAVQNALETLRLRCECFAEVEPNPSVETCQRCVDLYKDKDIGVIVAVGGGSAMDAAKAIGFGLAGGAVTERFEGAGLPLLAVPTAAGTGSEVTPYAVLTDRAARAKVCVPGRRCFDCSYVDPRFLATLPSS